MTDKPTKKYPAEYVVFWPGEEVLACKQHRDELRVLNDMMGGAPLSDRPLRAIGESGECSNCINGAKYHDD